MHKLFGLAALVWPLAASAQSAPELANILRRLERLERENEALHEEVGRLRARLDGDSGPADGKDGAAGERAVAAAPAAPPSVEERVDIHERRIEELAQTKVESSQKFPIRLTGIALFNAFLDSKQNGGFDYPTAAAPGTGRAGATLRQTIVGLDFRGPGTLAGGHVHGSVYMDFFSGTAPLNQTMRLRTGSIELAWKTRRVMAGIEKPIFNPREPSSLAQVGVSPLTGAGNLWLWLPQVRVEQDLAFGRSSGVRAQMGVLQTRELPPYDQPTLTAGLELSRPSLEGRFEFFHKFDDERRFELAPGFHVSTTHVQGFKIPSSLFSIDWFFNPLQRIEITGVFFTGQNVAHLGTGSIRQGYYVYGRYAEAIRSRGGWAQATIHVAPRLDFHVFTGTHDDQNSELDFGAIGKNLMMGGNLYYHLAPNVILGLETSHLRTVYIGQGTRINNHYDLALGYLF